MKFCTNWGVFLAHPLPVKGEKAENFKMKVSFSSLTNTHVQILRYTIPRALKREHRCNIFTGLAFFGRVRLSDPPLVKCLLSL